ncbi:MAG: phosphatase PAP2 family protein [bacterium]|nr:phosphatase PAP2 family protein [bacterium]
MMFPNWAKNILFLLVYMISGLVLVVIIDGLLSGTELIPLNTAIEQVVVNLRTPPLTTFLVWVTRLGSPSVLLSVAAFIAVLFVVRGRTYDAALFIVTLIVAVVSLTILKNTFQITRPGLEIIDVNGWSFPSGHATVATTFFFMLTYSFFNRMKTSIGKIVLILSSIFTTALISFSRLYLGAHWALDILAGFALGLLSVSFTVLVFSIFISDKRSLRDGIS